MYIYFLNFVPFCAVSAYKQFNLKHLTTKNEIFPKQDNSNLKIEEPYLSAADF